MSAQGLEVIDHTVHLTHEWIKELTERLDWLNPRDALRLLRATLHAIRDHLNVDETAQFSAQLPMLIRGMYYEGWVPKNAPIKARHQEAFINGIQKHIGEVQDYRGAEDITTVFKLINNHISIGEVEDVRANLPDADQPTGSSGQPLGCEGGIPTFRQRQKGRGLKQDDVVIVLPRDQP